MKPEKHINRLSNQKTAKQCLTVGAVITELQRLDPDTPIRQCGNEGVDVVFFNAGASTEHISFRAAGEFDESGA